MKRLLSLILAFCMVAGVMSALPLVASAEEYSGECGDNLTWTLDTETGVLTISGTGDMYDYYAKTTPWYDYRSYIKTVVVREDVTSIGRCAFYNYNNLTSVTIGESVTNVGASAFYYCYYLTEINWNAVSVTNFSSSDNKIFYNAGQGGTGIKVTFGNKVETIPAYCFFPYGNNEEYAPKITSVTIGNNVTKIGTYAFHKSYDLTEIKWNAANVTDFSNKNYVFSYAGQTSGGIQVIFGDSVETIPAYCFYPYDDTTYKPAIKNVTIGKNTKKIGMYAFRYCTGLTSLTIPDRVTSIEEGAFSKCNNLTSITIGENVANIGSFAFNSCFDLTSITMGNSITSIGRNSFYGCNDLTDVYYNGTEKEWNKISIDSNNTPLSTATIHFKAPKITLDGVEIETDGSIVLGTDNGDGTYSLPGNVVGYYIDDRFVDAGVYDVTGGEVITTVDFNVTMVNGAQVRYGGGLDENGKITSGNGLRFLAQVDRSNFDGLGYGMKLTAEGSDKETIVDAEKWQDDTTFTVALTDMAESNYIRKFTATPYVVVEYDDGTEKTIYGTQSVTRSIYNISAGLLTNDEEYADDLIAVLNAYVNQTGIRLVIGEIGGEIKAHSAKYGDTLHFAVSDAAYDSAGNAYSVILTAQGNAKIITDNDFWYEYIRINNNNSLIRDKVTVERVEGTADAVKVVFYADGLIERPADKNDNTTTDPAEDNFDGESEWN